MKMIGLIGGTSWVSTIEYYRIINQLANEKSGGLNSAELLLYSIDFGELKGLVISQDWQQLTDKYVGIVKRLQEAGAVAIVICANTPHFMIPMIQRQVSIPFLHIAEAAALEIKRRKLETVALLGTKFTMEENFFKDYLKEYGIECVIPDAAQREFIHDSIFNELGDGIFLSKTKSSYLAIMDELKAKGAKGFVLACTEIPMLLKQEDYNLPIFDTTYLHARFAAEYMLA